MKTNGVQNTEVAVVEEKSSIPMEAVDLTQGNLPDLTDAKEFPLDLMSNYWTPKTEGESKRLFYDCVKTRIALDFITGDPIELPCAFFYEKNGNDITTISNGSKRLVGIFESGTILRGTPLLVTYQGKRSTRKGFNADMWSVKPLLIKL